MTSRFRIRFAKIDDEPQILDFLKMHWKHNHVFVSNPELMRWQHRSVTDPEGGLNFVIAENMGQKDENPIVALLGYIPFRRFDSDADWTELSLAIWKVRDDCQVPGIGVQLLRHIERELSPALICAIGISEIVKPIYKALGYHLGSLHHAAIFAADSPDNPKIASGVPVEARLPILDDHKFTLQPLNDEGLLDRTLANQINHLGQIGLPRKSCSYIRERYCKHPWYRYHFRLACDARGPVALVVWRRVLAEGSSILRIVDIIGDPKFLYRCGSKLRREAESAKCEYIDVLCHGVSPEHLRNAGFVDACSFEGLILPNYFSPFEQRNVEIGFAFKKSSQFSSERVCLYRGDSDQDRPNSSADMIKGVPKG